MKFEEGDYVVGNKIADIHYGITRSNTYWYVIDGNFGTWDNNNEAYHDDIAENLNGNMIRICEEKEYIEYIKRKSKNKNPIYSKDFAVMDKCFNLVEKNKHIPNKKKSNVLESFHE